MDVKFSIIIPALNVQKYLKKCLDSILNQSYTNYEVVVVYDDSFDDSEKVILDYVKKYPKIQMISGNNRGLGGARNVALERELGDYIVFLDGDDFLEKNALRIINDNLCDRPDVLRFQAQDVTDSEIVKWSEEEFASINGIEAFNHIIKYHYVENVWCYTYKTEFWKKNNFKFWENCLAEDYGLLPLIIAKAESVKAISNICYNYVQRENSLMNSTEYKVKIKKMDDMIKQARYMKDVLSGMDGVDRFVFFINNSLLYFSTRLNKEDFKKYKRILCEDNCFVHLKGDSMITKMRVYLIKNHTWFYYHHIVR